MSIVVYQFTIQDILRLHLLQLIHHIRGYGQAAASPVGPQSVRRLH